MAATQASSEPTILLVDDSQTCRTSLATQLSEAGYQVLQAECGLEALALLQSHKPTWVLTDMSMPDIDGHQLCALIKQHPEFNHTAVFVMSAEDSPFMQAEAEMAGANAYLLKPFAISALTALLTQPKPLQER